MKTKIAIASFLFLGLCGVASAQQNQIVSRDTTKAAALYVYDSATFATKTGWVEKVTSYSYQFVQQPATDTATQFLVKKQKVPVESKYYLKGTTGKFTPVFVLAEFRFP